MEKDQSVAPDDFHAHLNTHAQSIQSASHVTFGDLINLPGSSTMGLILCFLSVPALLPSTGVPIGSLMSLGMFAIAWAMICGHDRIRLPQKLLNLKMAPSVATKLMNGLLKFYGWGQKYARPRYQNLMSLSVTRWLGFKVALMALLIFLPIPFGNTAPALAVMTLGFAMIFKDGLAVLASVVMAMIAVAVCSGLIWSSVWALDQVI